MNDNELKTKLHQHLMSVLDDRIRTAEESVRSATESRNNDTKNSAGDKYETGRAMMQQQIDLGLSELHKAEVLRNALKNLNPLQSTPEVASGSLVVTGQGNYYVSVGLGKVEWNGTVYFAVSPAAPLSQQLTGKKKGDQFLFAGIEYKILNVF